MIEKTNPKKVAVIRCDIVSETCPGVGCLKAFNERRSSFKQNNMIKMHRLSLFLHVSRPVNKSTFGR